MNPEWQAYLQSEGALIQDGRVAHFGDPAAERAAVQSATVVNDLSHFGLIRFAGEDAQSFLEGQLSCDVSKVGSSPSPLATYGGYCNPKGRLLASFLLWRDNSDYLMQLPSVLRAAIQKRLSMYVLRAKVKLEDASNNAVRMGIAGVRATALVQSIIGEISPLRLGVSQSEKRHCHLPSRRAFRGHCSVGAGGLGLARIERGGEAGWCALLGLAGYHGRDSRHFTGNAGAIRATNGKPGCNRRGEFPKRVLPWSGNRRPNPVPG